MSSNETLFWHALRALRRWGMWALAVWLVLMLLLAAIPRTQPVAPAFSWEDLVSALTESGFLMRMRELLVMTVSIWIWPVAMLALFFAIQAVAGGAMLRRGFGGRRAAADNSSAHSSYVSEETPVSESWAWLFATAAAHAFRFGAMIFAGFGALWAGMAVVAFIEGNDHWEALPGVTPPYLSEFLARHPALSVDRTASAGGRLTVYDEKGHALSLHGSELAGARVRFDICPAQLGAEQLGGITPYPGSRCESLIHLHNAAGEQLIHRFAIGEGSDVAALEAHFSRLSEARVFSGLASSKSGRRYQFSASTSDSVWRVEADALQGGAASILIRRVVVKCDTPGCDK